MHDGRDRATGARIGIWIGALVAGIVGVLLVGNMALGALLNDPALEQPTAPRAQVSIPSTQAVEASESSRPVTSTVDTSKIGADLAAALTAAADSGDTHSSAAQPTAKKSAKASSSAKTTHTASKPARTTKGVVVIDAGHQAKGDSSTEPIGPGASQRKPKVTSGAAGVATRNLESAINLKVAKKLKKQLEARGVKVIMVRTSQDVNISNSKRAAIANKAKADLFIRIHCDSIDSRTTTGLSTLVPGKNRWTGPIVADSKRAGTDVHKALIAATGAKDRGIVPRSDMSGFNWSKVPSVIVEMGFLSNPGEDRKLATSGYQDKLAKGLASGIATYLGR